MEQPWIRTNANCWTDTTLRGVNFTTETLFNQYSVRSWQVRKEDPLDPLTHIEFKSFNFKTHHDVNLVYFDGLNLVYCCLKEISFANRKKNRILPRIPRNLILIDEVSSAELFVYPSIFQKDWYFFKLLLPKFPNDPNYCFLNCSFLCL